MNLPSTLETILQPLFDALPLDQAMGQLVVSEGATPEQIALVESLLAKPEIGVDSPLAAGLWLYVDELDRSHLVSQSDESATGSYWHGIMHRREGDFSNSHYWFRRTGAHPAIAALPGYDPDALIDAVEAQHPATPEALVAQQRAEWANLFAWCASEE